ncbi:EF-Tu/IF-2/RF-3 family GTPase [Actinomycetaceae bacterium L2_0104]
MGIFRRKTEPVMSAESYVPSGGPFSFVVDDVFTITGRGTVLAGSVQTGSIHTGDNVNITVGAQSFPARIKGIEAFRRKHDYANAGEQAGLLVEFQDPAAIKHADLKGATVHS